MVRNTKGNYHYSLFPLCLANSADNKLIFWGEGVCRKKKALTFHANCVLLRVTIWSPEELICMKCQNLFSGKNNKKTKKNKSKCHLLKFLPGVLLALIYLN